MRFHYQIGMCDTNQYVPLAQAAEGAGFDGITIPDSICYPESATSQYPYNADGSREFLENEPFIESLIAVTAMAAVTDRIRFATFVYKLAVRQVVGVAKQVQSIQALSGDRFDFGIGISPWDEDFDAMQTPKSGRGKRFDEQIEIFQGLEGGDYFGYEGTVHKLPAIRMRPVPNARTPLLIGGHSEAALKRAARYDGWMCAGLDAEQVGGYVQKIRAYRAELGRDMEGYRVYTPSGDGFTHDGVERLAGAGVTDLVVGFRDVYNMQPDLPLDAKLEALQGYASAFIGS